MEKPQREQTTFDCFLPCHVPALDGNRIGSQREAHDRNRAWGSLFGAVRYESIFEIHFVREVLESIAFKPNQAFIC